MDDILTRLNAIDRKLDMLAKVNVQNNYAEIIGSWLSILHSGRIKIITKSGMELPWSIVALRMWLSREAILDIDNKLKE